MLSPSTPSRSASRIASTTIRCLLSPASDATWRCSLADTGLLAPLGRLDNRTAYAHSTAYDVRCTRQRESQLGHEEASVGTERRSNAGDRLVPRASPAGAATMRAARPAPLRPALSA